MRGWALAGCGAVLAGVALLVFAPVRAGSSPSATTIRSGLPVQLLLAGFVLLWLPFLWWLDRRLSWVLVPRYLTSLSRTITAVYLIQWALIGWLAIGLGVFDQPSWVAALLGVPILVASHLLALGYERLRTQWRTRAGAGLGTGAGGGRRAGGRLTRLRGRAASRTRSSRPGPPSSPR